MSGSRIGKQAYNFKETEIENRTHFSSGDATDIVGPIADPIASTRLGLCHHRPVHRSQHRRLGRRAGQVRSQNGQASEITLALNLKQAYFILISRPLDTRKRHTTFLVGPITESLKSCTVRRSDISPFSIFMPVKQIEWPR